MKWLQGGDGNKTKQATHPAGDKALNHSHAVNIQLHSHTSSLKAQLTLCTLSAGKCAAAQEDRWSAFEAGTLCSILCSIGSAVILAQNFACCIETSIDMLFDAGCLCRQHQQRRWYQGWCRAQSMNRCTQSNLASFVCRPVCMFQLQSYFKLCLPTAS